MRSALLALSLLIALPVLGQVNPATNIKWPQPSCATSGAPYSPKDNLCMTTTTTGGLPVNNPQYTGTMQGPNSIVNAVTANVNTEISVIAPPYNAKCDGVTDDQAAIQAAFNDAWTKSAIVVFPGGTCVTSKITWNGQSFRGAGRHVTVIKGKPGQDVFAAPDYPAPNYNNFLQAAYVRNLTILVDASIDASATAAGGNNTFPNRISGTQGGVSPVPGGTPVIGPVQFGPFYGFSNGGSINSGSTTLTVPGGDFQQRPNSWVVGTPILVKGAGASGADLNTTIATVLSQTQITLAVAASTTLSGNASGQWGNPARVTPPWYFGNCGIAIPLSDGNNGTSGSFANNLHVEDVWFGAYNGDTYSHHNCGFFVQTPPNDFHFDKVDFNQMWAGLVEALPAANVMSLFAWTPDTSSYHDVNFIALALPAIFYNGSHRTIEGFNIYSGEQPFALGLFWFSYGPSGGYTSFNSTITQYYDECWAYNSGEHARIQGNATDVLNGNMFQCGGNNNLYMRWDASYSTIGADVGNVQVYGSGNYFSKVSHGTRAGSFVNQGMGNTFITTKSYTGNNTINMPLRVNEGIGRKPINMLSGDFLAGGNPTTPYASNDDLIIPCEQFSFAFSYYGNPISQCTYDPTGTEITKSYAHLTGAYSGGWILSYGPNGGGQGTGPFGKGLIVGDRIPQSKLLFVMLARCDAACSQTLTINDSTTSTTLNYATISMGTQWTTVTLAIDASAVPVGDYLEVHGGGLSGSMTYQDIAWMGFSPVPANTILSATTPTIGGTAMTAGQCVQQIITLTGVTLSMAVSVSPDGDPGGGFVWEGWPGTNSAGVRLCALVAGTPVATTYNVRVIP